MEILDRSTATDAGEQKTVVQFQKGVDFETFEDFCELYMSILKSSELPGGRNTIKKLIESDTPGRLRSLPRFGGLSMTIPSSALDFDKLHARIRESETTIEQMGESRLSVEELTTTMLQIGWPGGTLTLRCTGVPKIGGEAGAEIQNAMQRFSSDCQMMFVWFAAILGSQNAMRDHLKHVAAHDEPFTINTYRPDGRVDAVLARVPVDRVVEAFTDAGDFERLYAKAFVVFTYQPWEEVARRRIATALNVESPNHIKSDLMGDLRYLRNWLVHRSESAESDFFQKAKMLPEALSMQRGDPSLTANGVATLMRHLNHMQVDVDPKSLDFGIAPEAADASMVAGMARKMKAGEGVALAHGLMYPSGVSIVFNEGPAATIHERDCSHAEEDLRSLEGGRVLTVTSRALARAVLAHLEKSERKCVHCT